MPGGYDGPVTEQTVLVVDDEAAIAEALRARLSSEGFRVLIAGDGPQALELAGAEDPDLVVLDLMLPGMDGLEVCRRLQAGRWVPVLMLTARTEEAALQLAAQVAANPPEAVARLKRMLHEWDDIEGRSRAEGEGQVEWQRSGPGLPSEG